MKKIMICYTSIGSGHLMAAEAIRDALIRRGKVDVQLLDTRATLNGVGRRLLPLGTIVSHGVLMHVYDWLWNSEFLGQLFVEIPKPARSRRHLMSHYATYRPDAIVCTHNFPCCVYSQARDQHRLSTPLVAVATDLQVHPYWPLHNIEHFVVASPYARTRLLGWGMNPNRISVLGIPLREQFADCIVPFSARSSQAVTRQGLIIAGGGQITPYARLLPQVIQLGLLLKRKPLPQWQWTFVTGSNTYLAQLLRWITRDNPQVTVTGYVDNMADLLARADVVLTKPGGVTVAECLALHKPMILLSKGAGQEAANTRYLTEQGAAMLSESAPETVKILQGMFTNGRAERMAYNATELSCPHAADNVADYVLNLLGETAGASAYAPSPTYNAEICFA